MKMSETSFKVDNAKDYDAYIPCKSTYSTFVAGAPCFDRPVTAVGYIDISPSILHLIIGHAVPRTFGRTSPNHPNFVSYLSLSIQLARVHLHLPPLMQIGKNLPDKVTNATARVLVL
jgi:hypothetical protein